MKLLTRFFTRLYQYATICIVVGAPLFFIPKTGFSGDVTYHIVMMLLVFVALFSYVFVATVTKNWHSVSKLEFISYFVFSFAVVASCIFSKNPKILFFGEAFNQFGGAALLTLPAVVYLVRTLPERIRHLLKIVILGTLAISAFAFVSALMIGGTVLTGTKVLFSGFSSSLSFAAFIGLFSLGCFFYIAKGSLQKRYKAIILVAACLFVAWVVTLSAQNSIRPNLSSTLLVGKKVMIEDGLFGIGAGNFTRAWQLHKPQDVINSSYFGYDFAQGADTMTTLFVTLGIVGLFAFMLLTLSALYSTIISYRQNKEGKEHIVLGLLTVTILYFISVAWIVPLSYAMLVMWMVISGLGIAKAHLTEFHPSKKLAYLFIPLVLIFGINAVVTINKVRAFSYYNQSQTAAKIEDAEALVTKAAKIYPFDGFYRVLVEYAITANRNLVATDSKDQEALKNAYGKKSAEAVDAGRMAVTLNSNNYQNYVSLGRAYELAIPFDKEKGFANAKKSYEEAINLYPENPYLYLMLARLETSAGTKEGVRTHLTDALKKKQNFADALYLMSQLQASENDVDGAIAYAIEAIKSAPNDPATYVQAGLLFYGKAVANKQSKDEAAKDFGNAVLALKTALEKDPNNANIAYFLALALRDGGEPGLAKPLADELLRRNPGNVDLQKFINSLAPIAQQVEPVIKTTTKAPTKK